MTPLHNAAMFGSAEVVEVLLDHKADIDALGPLSMTALHIAVTNAQLAKVQILLRRGAVCDLKNTSRQTALDLAQLANPEIAATIKDRMAFDSQKASIR
jgi:ankyrin repeat protein